MAQAELHFLHARLQGGKLNKAKKGELRFPLPVGYCYDEQGRIVPDAPVRYRSHWPRPTLSNNSTIWAVPANLPLPTNTNAWATNPERVHRVMSRPLPEVAGSVFVVILRFISNRSKRYYIVKYILCFARDSWTAYI